MSDAAEIEVKLRDLLADQLGVGPAITRASYLRADLGADSLDEVEIRFMIEEQFGIEMSEDDFERDRTVGDLVDLILQRIPESKAGEEAP